MVHARSSYAFKKANPFALCGFVKTLTEGLKTSFDDTRMHKARVLLIATFNRRRSSKKSSEPVEVPVGYVLENRQITKDASEPTMGVSTSVLGEGDCKSHLEVVQ